MQSHSNENGKDVMICNEITCAWDWTQVCHIYPAKTSVCQRINARNFANTSDLLIVQAVSEIFIFVFLFYFAGGP